MKENPNTENEQYFPEIIIGLVCPLGTDRKNLIVSLKEQLEMHEYHVETIKITDNLLMNGEMLDIPFSINTFFKMEFCSQLRKNHGGGILAALIINHIREKRKTVNNPKIAFIIDQIKNNGELQLLTEIYSQNYIQISCFSSKENRLKEISKKEHFPDPDILSFSQVAFNKLISNVRKNYRHLIDELDFASRYQEEILPNTLQNLMSKDFKENKIEDENHGQQLAELFHKSHFFINIDLTKNPVENQIRKFIELLFGEYKEYPTPDELGMMLAYCASKKSNFPGPRHVGACIVAKDGEVISVSSIRAPSSISNPNYIDEASIAEGYHKHKSQIKQFSACIENLKQSQNNKEYINDLTEIDNFLNTNIEHHPCTHAEISAILDAAKLGVSVRDAILYTTTFPCHICAKDIISAAISKVVFLEAYPKSKNELYYSNVIDIDPTENQKNKTPFYTFVGVGPEIFNQVYDLKNNPKNNKENLNIPLLKYRIYSFYEGIEYKISDLVNSIFEKENNDDERFKQTFKELIYKSPSSKQNEL